MISLQTSYRLDNRNYAGRAKDSDKQQVALHRRKTTTKRSQRREHDELPHPWVHLRILFVSDTKASRPAAVETTGRDLPRLPIGRSPGGRS
jgi:hypothetical protein